MIPVIDLLAPDRHDYDRIWDLMADTAMNDFDDLYEVESRITRPFATQIWDACR